MLKIWLNNKIIDDSTYEGLCIMETYQDVMDCHKQGFPLRIVISSMSSLYDVTRLLYEIINNSIKKPANIKDSWSKILIRKILNHMKYWMLPLFLITFQKN